MQCILFSSASKVETHRFYSLLKKSDALDYRMRKGPRPYLQFNVFKTYDAFVAARKEGEIKAVDLVLFQIESADTLEAFLLYKAKEVKQKREDIPYICFRGESGLKKIQRCIEDQFFEKTELVILPRYDEVRTLVRPSRCSWHVLDPLTHRIFCDLYTWLWLRGTDTESMPCFEKENAPHYPVSAPYQPVVRTGRRLRKNIL